jgi:biotin transport system ATP-binding protein
VQFPQRVAATLANGMRDESLQHEKSLLRPIGQPTGDGIATRPAGVGIVLDGVDYTVEGKPVLRELGFSVSARRLGVIGRNGSGKSTLARLVAGLVVPTKGTCRVNGRDLARDRKSAIAEVGILFQNPDHQLIFPTVLEEMMFGLRQRGQTRTEAEAGAQQALSVFGKAHWADAAVVSLSQGQKHLLCLMAVVAMAPALLILDEPFAGLDAPTRMQLRRYLDLYDGAVLHISHEPADFDGYDRMLWLDQGRIRASGAAGEVLAAYATEMTRLGAEDDISDLAG